MWVTLFSEYFLQNTVYEAVMTEEVFIEVMTNEELLY